MAMRKLQALRLISTPGVRTSTDVVIAIVNDIDRALLQAPSMYLARKAETTDWDAALASLGQDEDPEGDGDLAGGATMHGGGTLRRVQHRKPPTPVHGSKAEHEQRQPGLGALDVVGAIAALGHAVFWIGRFV